MSSQTAERSTGTIAKWGNGQGILIPKRFCTALKVKPGDVVDMSVCDNTIVIVPRKSYTLQALMDGYTGPPPTEYDWGTPKGKELW